MQINFLATKLENEKYCYIHLLKLNILQFLCSTLPCPILSWMLASSLEMSVFLLYVHKTIGELKKCSSNCMVEQKVLLLILSVVFVHCGTSALRVPVRWVGHKLLCSACKPSWTQCDYCDIPDINYSTKNNYSYMSGRKLPKSECTITSSLAPYS